jgi:hypothetical protein
MPAVSQPALTARSVLACTKSRGSKKKKMRSFEITRSLQCEQRNVADLMTEIATAKSDIALRSASALAQVCRAVITGEGPTTAGRIHFSRTIDADDVSLCARILILAGRHGDPVSRTEADVLFDINAVGSDRCEMGRFDDLLAKAVMHHVVSACGREVPRREIALAPENPLNGWTSAVNMNADAGTWLSVRLRELRPSSAAACAIMKATRGAVRTAPGDEAPVAGLFDLAA